MLVASKNIILQIQQVRISLGISMVDSLQSMHQYLGNEPSILY